MFKFTLIMILLLVRSVVVAGFAVAWVAAEPEGRTSRTWLRLGKPKYQPLSPNDMKTIKNDAAAVHEMLEKADSVSSADKYEKYAESVFGNPLTVNRELETLRENVKRLKIDSVHISMLKDVSTQAPAYMSWRSVGDTSHGSITMCSGYFKENPLKRLVILTDLAVSLLLDGGFIVGQIGQEKHCIIRPSSAQETVMPESGPLSWLRLGGPKLPETIKTKVWPGGVKIVTLLHYPGQKLPENPGEVDKNWQKTVEPIMNKIDNSPAYLVFINMVKSLTPGPPVAESMANQKAVGT